MVYWQELLGEQSREVTVEAGSTVTLDFRYTGEKGTGKR